MEPDITIVIPCRDRDPQPFLTILSLLSQTYKNFKVVVVYDQGKGANWARNKGFESVDTEFVLFSDDDIRWLPRGVESLRNALDINPEVSYSYGSFMLDEDLISSEQFSADLLRGDHNFISTMSLIRSADFPGFDEQIKRLQDWDLWLTMLENGKVGIHCGEIIFVTSRNNSTGISSFCVPGLLSLEEAEYIIKTKHGLKNP